ncbi:molecular chaperone TorD family protein [Geovibrio sp. ADMFC3]
MNNTAEYSEVFACRGNMYSFLAQLYKTEVNDGLISSIKNIPDAAEGTDEFTDGIRIMKKSLKECRDTVTELAVDYAGTFLGAGKTETEMSAYPYQSVYTSPKRLLMQDARDRVLAVYRKFGLDRSEKYNEPEDHIFFELEFMSELCKRLSINESRNERAECLRLLNAQRDFITDHLLNWIPSFCRDVERVAETGFYKGLAKITTAYLQMDAAIVNDLITEYELVG